MSIPCVRPKSSRSLSVPLYAQGGAVYSSVREAKQLASQRRIQVIEVARPVRKAVAEAWNAYVAYGDIIANARTEVSAAELALNGVQQEYQAGTRTTQDVLDAQSLLVTAKTKLVNAEKNRVVAAYQMLAAIGHLTAQRSQSQCRHLRSGRELQPGSQQVVRHGCGNHRIVLPRDIDKTLGSRVILWRLWPVAGCRWGGQT